MSYLRLFLLACSWLLALGAAQAQGRLSGVVRDSTTNEPLAFASVFLANTTLGTTTTEQGEFEFKRVPKGTYDVVGSYVGYRLSKQSVTVGAAAAPQQLTLRLASNGNQLGEVVVQPAPNKPEEFQRFSEMLLGQSSFSEQCRISNPEQVRVFYDDSTRELTARAREFVQIDNDALGYRLKYYGLYFAYDDEAQSITYYGEPVFQELTPRDESQRQLWATNRATAYRGSFMHFLRSVYTNRLRAEGFLTQRVGPGTNPRFARAERQRRALLARRPGGANLTASERDSLARWEREPATRPTIFPVFRSIDSLRRVSPDGQHAYLRFHDELRVTYLGETPDPRYGRPALAPMPAPATAPAKRQVSRLQLTDTDGEAELQADGALLNPLEVAIGDYWGFEKIGEFLPYDYVPAATTTPAGPATP
ncbi:carboxypeptidase-like regulatory domain-containing protein [uncultured Hymenobacter sp.]|uniref:carboxypeptidase-like regulatory domain-containing protein n=1 Tax=uncultured Hymenobacter sp. TaxID=170016 RepID=UPI0035C9BC73